MGFKPALCRKVVDIFAVDIVTTPILDFNFLHSFMPLLLLFHAGIHSTLKLGLRRVLIPLNKTLLFFRESLIRRKLNVDRRQSIGTIKVMLEEATAAGFSRFAKHLTASLTDEGIKLTLEQFKRSFGYKVDKIVGDIDIEAAFKALGMARGPSGQRFRCLISNTEDGNDASYKFIEGDYFKVTSRSINGSIDIVFISPSGNIACTSPSYARWGLPSKHIIAVFYHGRICLNMKQHFHPVYHLHFMNDVAIDAVADFTVMSDVPHDTVKHTDATTCWNWAQKISHESWEIIGLGGTAYKALAYPTAKSNSNAPESIAEKTKKAINFIVPYVNSSLEEREIFYLYYEGLLKRYNFYLKFIVLIMILI